MNKILLGAVACCIMGAPSVFGSNVNTTCSPFPTSFANGAGSGSAACPGFDVPLGDTLTGVEIWYESDFQFGATDNTVVVTFTPGADFVTSPTSCTIFGAASTSDTNSCGVYSGVVNAPGTTEVAALSTDWAALAEFGFSVSESSIVTSGSVATSSAAVIVEYDFTPTVTSSAPEPGSMMLLGSGLLVAGLIGRKKLVRQ